MSDHHSHSESEHERPKRIPPLDGTVDHAPDGMAPQEKNITPPVQKDGKINVGSNGTLDHTPDAFIHENDILLGHYQVLSCLRGGMGVVYKCKDTNVKNTFVALKTVQTEGEMTEVEQRRMQESFKLVHALRHDHIVSANSLEFDRRFGRWFVAMDWIDGEDLETRLGREKGGRLPVAETLRLLRQVADALDYAHDAKKGMIVHRDVKCANIMVRKDGEALLIDFGIAWRTSASKNTVTSNIMPDDANLTWGNLTSVINPFSGTRGYQSPEQWEGMPVTPASDQYSLAVTAYRCLSGHLPFLNANDGQMQEMVLHDPVPEIKTISADANKVLAKGMAKRADERYGRCTEFIDELSKTLSGEDVVSEMPPETPAVSPIVTEVDVYLYLDTIEKYHDAFEKGDWDRGQTFGVHMDDFARYWKLAAVARNDHSYKAAYELLQRAETEWKWIERNEPLRADALKRRDAAEQARKDAEPLQPEVYAEAIYRDAKRRNEEAEERLAEGAFDIAAEGFSSAYEAFTAAGASAAAEHIEQLERRIAECVAEERFSEAKAVVEELSGLDMAKAKEREAVVESARQARIAELTTYISNELEQLHFAATEEPLWKLAEIDEEKAEIARDAIEEALAENIRRLEGRVSEALTQNDFDAAAESVCHLREFDEAKGTEWTEKVKKAKDGYIGQLEKDISAVIDAGCFDVAREDVKKLSAIKPEAVEKWDNAIRVRELELSIDKSLEENDFSAAAEIAHRLGEIDERMGGFWAEKVIFAKDAYVCQLGEMIRQAIDDGRFGVAIETVEKLSVINADAAERWENVVHVRKLELSIEKSLAQNDFAVVAETVSKLATINKAKGDEWSAKVQAVKTQYVGQLESAISKAIDDKHFEEAEEVIRQLLSIDEAKATELTEKLAIAKNKFEALIAAEKKENIGQLEAAISTAIEGKNFKEADEHVRQLAAIDQTAAETCAAEVANAKVTRVNELKEAIRTVVDERRFAVVDSLLNELRTLDTAAADECNATVDDMKKACIDQMEVSVKKLIAGRDFAQAEKLAQELIAVDQDAGHAQAAIVQKAKDDCIHELEQNIYKVIQQSHFNDAREYARQLGTIDRARGEKCDAKIQREEEEKIHTLTKDVEDAIHKRRFVDAQAVVNDLAVMNAGSAAELREKLELAEKASLAHSRHVRKWLLAGAVAMCVCLLIGGACLGYARWRQVRLVQTVTILEEYLRDHDKELQSYAYGYSLKLKQVRIIDEHLTEYNSVYDKGGKAREAGNLAEAHDYFQKAKIESEWLEANLPLSHEAVDARQSAEKMKATAEKTEAPKYALEDYQNAMELFQNADKELNDGQFEQSRESFENAQKAFEKAISIAVNKQIVQLEQNIAASIQERNFAKAVSEIGRLEKLDAAKAAGWKEKLSDTRKEEEEKIANERKQKAERISQLEKSISDYIRQKDFAKAEGDIAQLGILNAEKAVEWKQKLIDARRATAEQDKAELEAKQKAEQIKQLEQNIDTSIQNNEFTKADNYVEELAKVDANKGAEWTEKLNQARNAKIKENQIHILELDLTDNINKKEFVKVEDNIGKLNALDVAKAAEWNEKLNNARKAEVEKLNLILLLAKEIENKKFEEAEKSIEKLENLDVAKATEWKEKLNQARKAEHENVLTYKLSGDVELKLIKIEPGSFTNTAINKTITLTRKYWLGETEVTQGQYAAIMDGVTNELEMACYPRPSYFEKGRNKLLGVKDDDLPVEGVWWYDAKAFCQELNRLFKDKLPQGYHFDLPTEAQWEFAARGGNKSKGYEYSGGNRLDDVGWYCENSGQERLDENSWSWEKYRSNQCQTHPVAQKEANELGLYDMTGNVSEWCRDCGDISRNYDPETLTGMKICKYRIACGGSYNSRTKSCLLTKNHYIGINSCHEHVFGNDIGFRVALVPIDSTVFESSEKANHTDVEKEKADDNNNAAISDKIKQSVDITDVAQKGIKYKILTLLNGVELKLIKIEPGSFANTSMSKTITLTREYWLGETEVTQGQYAAIMNGVTNKIGIDCNPRPSRFKGDDRLPVECVSWLDAKAFCKELNRLLKDKLPQGYQFDLPTEAQWEFAARGGNKSKGYEYSGSNTLRNVGWYYGYFINPNKYPVAQIFVKYKTHPVAQKDANELGLYDMSGNVWEWCRDWWSYNWSRDPETLVGMKNTRERVYRGGSYSCKAEFCRTVWRKHGKYPTEKSSDCGFRVALVPVQ